MCVPADVSMPSHAVIFGRPEFLGGVYFLIASQRSLSVVLGPESLLSRSSIDGVLG